MKITREELSLYLKKMRAEGKTYSEITGSLAKKNIKTPGFGKKITEGYLHSFAQQMSSTKAKKRVKKSIQWKEMPIEWKEKSAPSENREQVLRSYASELIQNKHIDLVSTIKFLNEVVAKA